MKILFCTNSFETISNGPAKFANLLLHNLNSIFPESEIRILTEDVSAELPGIYKLNLVIPKILKPAGMVIRMFQYHRQAKRIHKQGYKFDTLVYNNAIVSLYSAVFLKNIIGFINDDNYVSEGIKLNIFNRRNLRSNLFYFFEWLGCRLLKTVIVNSDYLRNKIISGYNANPVKVVKLYKAVELPAEYIIRKNPVPIILFVKNDYKRGGLYTLSIALRMLKRKFICIIVGTPISADAEIKEWFKDSEITIDIKGYQSQEVVYEHMRKADIFSVPSLKEALGVSNIEAMRLGCAIVTSNVGGIPETTDNGGCAWMVNPGDSNALAKSIDECLSDQVLRQKKIEYAYSYSEIFSVDKMIRNFVSIVRIYEQKDNN